MCVKIVLSQPLLLMLRFLCLYSQVCVLPTKLNVQEQNFKQRNPYSLEHVDLINHLRKGTSHIEAEECAISCLAGVMGREAAYTGATVTWDEISGADMNFLPENLELGNVDMSQYKVPVPGNK